MVLKGQFFSKHNFPYLKVAYKILYPLEAPSLEVGQVAVDFMLR